MTARTGEGRPDRGQPQSHSADIAELRRRLDNVVRVGRVSAVDHKAQRFRVKIGSGEDEGLETDWLRVGSERAGSTHTSRQLSLNEQVSVHAPSGRLEQAYIGPSIPTTTSASPSEVGELFKERYPDGTTHEYNDVTHAGTLINGPTSIIHDREHVSAKVGSTEVRISDGEILLTVGGKGIRISGSGVSVTGGSLDHQGINVGKDHKHGGVQGGPSTTGNPV